MLGYTYFFPFKSAFLLSVFVFAVVSTKAQIINVQPQSQVVCPGSGQSATFSVTATGSGLSYQWMKNGVNIPGATNSTFTIAVVTAVDAGAYQVVVTNADGAENSNIAYLNTSINSQPSPASQTVVTGNTVVYTISANNATSFQWKKNGVDIPGATDSIFTISPLNSSDDGIYTVSVINSAGNGCADIVSNSVSLTSATVVYSKSTTDINIPSTWGANADGSGSNPVDFTRAEHTFVLSNRSSGNTVTNLTIAGTLDVKDGEVVIGNNTMLDLGQCIRSGTGSISGSTSSGLTLRGNSNLYFTPGSQFLKNFTITGGTINMLSDLTISGGTLPGKLNLIDGTLALGDNKITIQSTSTTNTSMVTAVGSAASITYGSGGAFIVERFIPGKRAYRFISPAVTTTTSIKTNWMEGTANPDRWTNSNPNPGYGTHITGSGTTDDSLDVTQTSNPSLFIFDKTSQVWNPVRNSSSNLTAGSPFRLMVRGSRAVDLNDNNAPPSNTIIRTTGSLTTGTVNVGSSILSGKIGDYSFVGNPYACPVDWRALTKSGISRSYYTWDEKVNARGAYVSYNGLSETNSSPASSVDHNIQSEQAFFVQSTSTTPSIQFTEASKSYTNTAVFRSSSTMPKLAVQLLLNLNGGSNNVADGFTAVYDDTFSPAIADEDSYKFPNLDENMAISRDGNTLSIEGRPLITTADTLPVKMWQFRQKDYWIKVDGTNFSPLVSAVLKDEYLDQAWALDLSSVTEVPFSINADPASSAPNRFSIVFNSYTTLPVELTNVKAYQKDKGIQVEWQTTTETNVDRYEVERSLDGRQFEKLCSIAAKSDHGVTASYNWVDNNATDGNHFYRIRTIEKNANAKYSSIVKVNVSNDNSGFTIFPNPIKGNSISLRLSDIEEGEYAVAIYNSGGQKIFNTSIQHRTGSSSLSIFMKQKMAKGSYTFQLSNDKKSLTRPIFVE